MSAGYFASFAAICGLVIAGLDYHQQSKKTEGGLSARAYVASVSSRMAGGDVAAETRAFLPAAPDGWERRALGEGQAAPLWAGTNGPDAQKAATRGWIYAKGDEIIWIEAFRNDLPKSKGVTSGMAEISASEIAYQPEYAGFAVLGGVGFSEMVIPSWKDPLPFQVYDGWVGFDDEIQIRVRAEAPEASVRAILSGVDFDGLNGLLDAPIPTIGNTVEVQPQNEAVLADQMMVLRHAMVRFRAEAAAERKLNADEAAELINTFIENIVPEATLDATGGEVPDYESLIQTTYRNGLALIMANDKSAKAAEDTRFKMTCTQEGDRKRCRSDG